MFCKKFLRLKPHNFIKFNNIFDNNKNNNKKLLF